jgi:hypothetical protein
VGIISIVFASLGVGCIGCSGIGMALMPSMMKAAEDKMGPMPAVMQPPAITWLLLVAGLAWAGMELAAGITTLRRKPVGRTLHIIYGAGAMLMSVLSLALQWQQHSAQMSWAASNAGSEWAKQINSGGLFFIIGMAFALLIGFSYPVFCLIWFGMLKKRPDAGWVKPELDAI